MNTFFFLKMKTSSFICNSIVLFKCFWTLEFTVSIKIKKEKSFSLYGFADYISCTISDSMTTFFRHIVARIFTERSNWISVFLYIFPRMYNYLFISRLYHSNVTFYQLFFILLYLRKQKNENFKILSTLLIYKRIHDLY